MSSNLKEKSKYKRRKALCSTKKNEICHKSVTVQVKIENVTNESTENAINSKCENQSLVAKQNYEISQNVNSGLNICGKISKNDSNERKPICVLQRTYIPTSFIKKRLNYNLQDSSDNVYQIMSGHCDQVLKKVIKLGICYMNRCGRTEFTVEDFKVGLYCCGEQFGDYIENFFDYIKKCNKPSDTLKIDGSWLNNDTMSSNNVTSILFEQQIYFNEITKILLIEKEEVCSIIWNDLITNDCILHLLPYFVKFLSNCIDKLSNNFLRISLLLKTMYSLLYNPYLCFTSECVNTLAFTLLEYLLKDLPYINEDKDCYMLKDYAANLLGIILKKSKSRKLLFDIMHIIKGIFSKVIGNSFVSQYGAIVILNAIGVPVIMLLIPSYIDKYYEYLCACINHTTSIYEKYDIHMLLHLLIHSHYLLMQHYFKYEFYDLNTKQTFYFPDSAKIKVFPVLLQLNFSEYFGDCLVHHFPLLNFISYNVNLKVAKIKKTIRRRNIFNVKTNNRKQKPNHENIFKIHEIFDVVSLKKHTIKFGKIKGTNQNFMIK